MTRRRGENLVAATVTRRNQGLGRGCGEKAATVGGGWVGINEDKIGWRRKGQIVGIATAGLVK